MHVIDHLFFFLWSLWLGGLLFLRLLLSFLLVDFCVFLWVGYSDWLQGLAAESDGALDFGELCGVIELLGPLWYFLERFHITCVEHSLEGLGQGNRHNNISKGLLAAYEPPIALDKSIVDLLDITLQILQCFFPFAIVHLSISMTVNTCKHLLQIGNQIRAGPVHPLVDKCAIQGTSRRVKLLLYPAHVFANGNSSANSTTTSFKHRKHSRWILSLKFLTQHLLIIHKLKLKFAAKELSEHLDNIHLVRAGSRARNDHFPSSCRLRRLTTCFGT